MPVEYGWYKGRHDIILVEVSAPWTWLEGREVFLKTQEMMAQQDNLVSFITLIHTSVFENLLLNLEGFNLIRYPHAGKTYVVGGGMLLEMVISVMKRMNVPLMTTFENVSSLEEALTQIAEDSRMDA